MKKIIFTDTHFGVKQNSITWLNSQKKFIYDQLIEYIINLHEDVEVIHLGDVFDSRSTISTFIANEVVNIFKSICNCKNVIKLNIVAGNHDFYSPNSDEVNTLNLILSNVSDKINIIYNESFIDTPYLYVPWYEWFDQNNIQKLIDKYNIKYVFTHADIISSPIDIKGVKIFSGHTHIPYIKSPIYNLGSCYALNFGDSNNPRGFYILYDDGKISFKENISSIKFWRFFNNDIWNLPNNISNDDYIEIYIDQDKLSESDCYEIISGIQKRYKNTRIIPKLPQNGELKMVDFNGYDIENVINDFIPEKLKDKFKKISEKNKSDY